jgi:hypothetical protein
LVPGLHALQLVEAQPACADGRLVPRHDGGVYDWPIARSRADHVHQKVCRVEGVQRARASA